MAAMVRSPKRPIGADTPGGLWVQPVEADGVAVRLVEFTFVEPAGLVPDMGGRKSTARPSCSAGAFGPLGGMG